MLDATLKKRFVPYQNAEIDIKIAITREVFQEIILSGLSEARFFDRAGFYGGTALRIFHQLPRFSEDLDFTLLLPSHSARIDQAFPSIEQKFHICGINLPIEMFMKDKKDPSNITTGFVTLNLVDSLNLFFDQNSSKGINPDRKIKIKIECDDHPALGFNSEPAFRNFPFDFTVMVLDLPSLFAGKLAACIGRQWEKRVKGRDFYDLAYLLRIGAKVNLTYLENKLRQADLFKGNHLDIETVKAMLRERFAKIDWQLAYRDVLGFLEPGITLRYFEEAFFSSIVGDLQPA